MSDAKTLAPIIYHGTPMTPKPAFRKVMLGRAVCVSYYRPDQSALADETCTVRLDDNGAFSFWNEAKKAGREADEASRDWRPYYEWTAPRAGRAGCLAIIPDVIGAPSQVNDALLNEWPHGNLYGVPVWHMNGPISRLPRLLERYSRVALGWVGRFENGKPVAEERAVGCDAYFRRLDEIDSEIGDMPWNRTHMLRGIAVARERPFRQRGQHLSRSKRLEEGLQVRLRRPLAWKARIC